MTIELETSLQEQPEEGLPIYRTYDPKSGKCEIKSPLKEVPLVVTGCETGNLEFKHDIKILEGSYRKLEELFDKIYELSVFKDGYARKIKDKICDFLVETYGIVTVPVLNMPGQTISMIKGIEPYSVMREKNQGMFRNVVGFLNENKIDFLYSNLMICTDGLYTILPWHKQNMYLSFLDRIMAHPDEKIASINFGLPF